MRCLIVAFLLISFIAAPLEGATCKVSRWTYSKADRLVCVADKTGSAIFGVKKLPRSSSSKHQEYAIFLKYTDGTEPSALAIMYVDGNYAGPICDGLDGCSIDDDMVSFVLSSTEDAALLLGLKVANRLRIDDGLWSYQFTLKGSSAAIDKLLN